MNLKKLLTLSAAALLVGTTAVGCGGKDKTETLTAAAEYIWQMYRNNDEKVITGSFDVVNKVLIGDETVSITWNLEATGSKDAFSVVAKDDNFSTIKVAYYDGLVTEASSVKLVPTFTIGEQSLTLADVYAEEQAKHAIDFTTPVLVLNNHADWDKNDGAVLNIKGTVVDVIKTGSSTGSIYMVDAEGNGYYVYNPATKGAKVGDVIVVTGSRSDYSGQEEFAKNGTYGIVESGKQDTISFVNASEDWAAATSNKVSGSLAAKYQNVPVKLEKCTPTRISGSYYYFKVGNGTTEFNVYKNTYFLEDEQIDAWTEMFEDAITKGYTLTIEGISTVYSSSYQVYPCSIKSNVLTKEAELTADEKHVLVKNALEGAIAESYDSNSTIEFEIPSYATVSLEVASPAEGATVSIDEGKIVVAPTPVATENKVNATVTIGESTKVVELTINTAALKYDGYKTAVEVADLVEGETPVTKDVVKEAVTYDGADKVDVTFSVKDLYKDYSAIYFGKDKTGDVLTISVPSGYVISKLEINQYGTHPNFKFHKGSDATGEEIDYTLTDSFIEVAPNCNTVTIDNPSSYNCSFYDVSVTVSKTAVGLTAANLLGYAGTNVAYGDGTATVDGIGLSYIQASCYGDGIQMRNKTSDGGVASSIQTTTAIESGIKSVDFVYSATKDEKDRTGMIKVEFAATADFANAEVVMLDTVAGTKEYTVTPTVATHKYVRITNNLGYTTYWDSIAINY